MKAIVYHTYGPPDVLTCEDTPKPAPADDQVLIRVRAAAVNPVDRMFRGTPFVIRLFTGLRRPKEIRFGRDVAGEVEAIGRNVTRFKPGDAVFGSCRGACAEYACAAESALAPKPPNVTFEQAAGVPVVGYTALQGLRDKGRIGSGQRVLINGASGGVGTFAVQVAKSFGADVTGVCSTRNVDLVRTLGADHVIDYTRQDFTRGTERYDLLFDCVGNHSVSALRRVLQPNGKCVLVGAPHSAWLILARGFAATVLSLVARQNFVMFMARLCKEDLTIMAGLMEAGTVKPVIDRSYPMALVPDAMRYLEQGHARGKVVITM